MNDNLKAYFMLTLCAFFWSGNFIVGKFATLYEVPPLTLNFLRWLIVWIILIPFTFRDILKNINDKNIFLKIFCRLNKTKERIDSLLKYLISNLIETFMNNLFFYLKSYDRNQTHIRYINLIKSIKERE